MFCITQRGNTTFRALVSAIHVRGSDKDRHCHLNPGAVHRVHDGVQTKTNRFVYMLGRGWSQTNKPGLDEQDHQHTKGTLGENAENKCVVQVYSIIPLQASQQFPYSTSSSFLEKSP